MFITLSGNENAATLTQTAIDKMFYHVEFTGNTVAAGDWVCWMRKDEQTDCTGCSSAGRYPDNGGQVVALGDGMLQQDIILDGVTDGAPLPTRRAARRRRAPSCSASRRRPTCPLTSRRSARPPTTRSSTFHRS